MISMYNFIFFRCEKFDNIVSSCYIYFRRYHVFPCTEIIHVQIIDLEKRIPRHTLKITYIIHNIIFSSHICPDYRDFS